MFEFSILAFVLKLGFLLCFMMSLRISDWRLHIYSNLSSLVKVYVTLGYIYTCVTAINDSNKCLRFGHEQDNIINSHHGIVVFISRSKVWFTVVQLL